MAEEPTEAPTDKPPEKAALGDDRLARGLTHGSSKASTGSDLGEGKSSTVIGGFHTDGSARQIFHMLVKDESKTGHGQSYSTLITDTGRLKLLHDSADVVKKVWQEHCKQEPERASPVSVQMWEGNLSEESKTRLAAQNSPTSRPKRLSKHTQELGSVTFISGAVEFMTQAVSAMEDDTNGVEIPVRRTGDLDAPLEVTWKLVNGNVDKYYGQVLNNYRGSFTFETGVEVTSFRVPVVRNPAWTTDEFYTVYLEDMTVHSDFKQFVFGKNREISVYIMNVEEFPTTIWGFLQHNFTEMPRKTVIGVILCLAIAVKYYCTAQLLATLVSCVGPERQCLYWLGFGIEFDLGSGRDHPWLEPIMKIAVIEIFLFIFGFWRERTQRRLRLGGIATRKLRSNLFSIMLQMSTEAKESYDMGDLTKIIDSEADMAVNEVWLGAFNFCGMAAELVVKMGLTLQVAVLMEERTPMLFLLVTLLVEFCLVIAVLRLRSEAELEMHRGARDAEEHWHAFVQMCEQCVPIINLYGKYEDMTVSTDVAHGAINKLAVMHEDRSVGTVWILRAMFLLCRLTVVIVLAREVMESELDVGKFVMTNKVLADFGKTLVDVSQQIQEILRGRAPIEKVATALNQETFRKSLYNKTEGTKCQMRETSAIVLKDVTYMYPATTGGSAVLAVHPVNLRIIPNQLVCILRKSQRVSARLPARRLSHSWSSSSISHHQEEHELQSQTGDKVLPGIGNFGSKYTGGKVGIDTLFKLLARELKPTTGSIEMPERWRVVYVPVMPVLFDGTLMYNLAFGILGEDQVKTKAVWNACRDFGMSPELLGQDCYDVGTNGERLKLSDRLCISIVRALLFDVDVLAISSVLDILGEEKGREVLHQLHKYVLKGSLPGCESDVPREYLHRKTVLYSTRFAALQEPCCDTLVSFTPAQQEPAADDLVETAGIGGHICSM